MAIDRDVTDEEAALIARMTRDSWSEQTDSYRSADLDQLTDLYTEDAISIPAGHEALRGHGEIRAWYALRTNGYEMNAISEVDSIDIIGEVAVLTGIFRVTRRPEQNVAGLDHSGRWLAVMRKVDGEWKMWRDADTPSPDADILYQELAKGL
jgi:ketosteroid isomerase-like protein